MLLLLSLLLISCYESRWSTWHDKSWGRQALMHWKRKRFDSWRTGWKAKACTSFALYLKVFKKHLYHFWHVRVLSIKPCLHTKLPEHNRNYWKFPGDGGIWSPGMDLWLDIWTAFWPGRGKFEQTFFKNSNGRGVARGGMFKLPFDWYIRCRNVFSEGKFRKVKHTFLTPSRQPLNRFSWHLTSLLSDSFPQKTCRRFLFSFSLFE